MAAGLPALPSSAFHSGSAEAKTAGVIAVGIVLFWPILVSFAYSSSTGAEVPRTLSGPAIYNNLDFDPVKDFAPLAALATESLVLVVPFGRHHTTTPHRRPRPHPGTQRLHHARVTWGCVLRRPRPRPPGPDAGSRACSPLRPVSRSPWPMKKRFFVMHITSRARRIR
jgi:hypothetical protein